MTLAMAGSWAGTPSRGTMGSFRKARPSDEEWVVDDAL
jgi:hypothetical protein